VRSESFHRVGTLRVGTLHTYTHMSLQLNFDKRGSVRREENYERDIICAF
jgi:hypothetical protein